MTEELVTLTVDDAPFEVARLRGHEGLSRLFRYDLVIAGGTDPGRLVGAQAEATVRDGFGGARTIHGVVVEAEEETHDDDHIALRVVLRPRAFRHTLGRDARIFQHATVVEIVNGVLAEPPRWDTRATYAPHVYSVQYREDDWTFVCRLLEEEGIYYWFDHEEQSALVLADTSGAAPDLAGGAAMQFASVGGMARPRESVVEIGATAAVAPTRFTVASFNPSNPSLEVKSSVGDGRLEIYLAPGGGPDAVEECARQARFRKEASACDALAVTGAATSARLVPGRIVEIVGHPVMDGRYLVVSMDVDIVQPVRGDRSAPVAGSPYRCEVGLLPASIPFRPRRASPPARQAGLQLGVVVGERGAEVHPDDRGRVRVQHHWDRNGRRDERAGTWMRVAQRGAAGSMLLPRSGWNVATLNDEGEIDAPSVLSRLHDGEHPPAYPLPANKTRVVYKTATTPGGGSFNEIHFEDERGGERMFWNASKDMAVLVKNDAGEAVTRDARRTVAQDELVDVVAAHRLAVAGDRTVRVGGDETLTVAGSSDKAIERDERIAIGGMRSVKSGKEHSVAVEKTRRLEVGLAQVDATAGPISARAERITTLVGGARVRIAGAGLSDSAGWASVQTVGAAKIEMIAQSRTTTVKLALVETVGGTMVLDAGGSFTESSKKAASFRVGGAFEGRAPAIHIEAQKAITLTVGATSITISPDEIRIASATLTGTSPVRYLVQSPTTRFN